MHVQALSNIRTVMAFNGQEVTKAKYREALALPQSYTIRQGFVSGLVMGTIYGETCLAHCKLACSVEQNDNRDILGLAHAWVC
jgi:ABC transporter transmembrane region